VNPPIDSVTEGSGLGLYLSQKIANMLGGEITVTSTFNKGSIFTLKIPADISQSVR
ncbi:MAG TPA: HAMP domain-containing histidine kinase, partial [Euryarchaeota archaeon]|nr:HAMP domain-containing histidine kinase [Euryarchaeota archaeon]